MQDTTNIMVQLTNKSGQIIHTTLTDSIKDIIELDSSKWQEEDSIYVSDATFAKVNQMISPKPRPGEASPA